MRRSARSSESPLAELPKGCWSTNFVRTETAVDHDQVIGHVMLSKNEDSVEKRAENGGLPVNGLSYAAMSHRVVRTQPRNLPLMAVVLKERLSLSRLISIVTALLGTVLKIGTNCRSVHGSCVAATGYRHDGHRPCRQIVL